MTYRVLQGCPHCGRYAVHASRLHGLWERLRRRITKKWPFRCRACGWRGWAHQNWDRRQHADSSGHQPARRADDRAANDAGTRR